MSDAIQHISQRVSVSSMKTHVVKADTLELLLAEWCPFTTSSDPHNQTSYPPGNVDQEKQRMVANAIFRCVEKLEVWMDLFRRDDS